MKKIKKILLAIPLFFITLYSKVNAVQMPSVQDAYGPPPIDTSKYNFLYWIILVPLAVIILGVVGLINIKLKDKPKNKRIVIAVCSIAGICIFLSVLCIIKFIISILIY